MVFENKNPNLIPFDFVLDSKSEKGKAYPNNIGRMGGCTCVYHDGKYLGQDSHCPKKCPSPSIAPYVV